MCAVLDGVYQNSTAATRGGPGTPFITFAAMTAAMLIYGPCCWHAEVGNGIVRGYQLRVWLAKRGICREESVF